MAAVFLLALPRVVAASQCSRRTALTTASLPLSAAAAAGPRQREVVRYADEADDQVAECYYSAQAGGGPRPVVALLHGGYWRQGYGRDLMDAVARDVVERTEFHCVNVEYRRGPGSCERASSDVAACLAWLASPAAAARGLDASNVALVGHSAGGQLAMRHALRGSPAAGAGPGRGRRSATVRCAVSCGGVLDLREARARNVGGAAVADFLGEGGDVGAASPIELLPPAMTSSLRSEPRWRGVGDWEDAVAATTKLACVHGLDDSVVPAALSTRFTVAAAVGGLPVEYHQIKREGHFEVLKPASTSWRATRAVVEGALRAAPLGTTKAAATRSMAPTSRVDTDREIVITTLRAPT